MLIDGRLVMFGTIVVADIDAAGAEDRISDRSMAVFLIHADLVL